MAIIPGTEQAVVKLDRWYEVVSKCKIIPVGRAVITGLKIYQIDPPLIARLDSF